MELIDVYDVNQIKLGSEEREDVHKIGLWHKTFHCWILTRIKNENCIVYQLRSKSSSFPGYLDVSAAGHFKKDETKDKALREIKEELGLSVAPDALIYLGQRIEMFDLGEFKNREFQDIFLMRFQNFKRSIKPDISEVSGIFWMPIKQGLKLFSLQQDTIAIEGHLFDYKKNKWTTTKRVVSIKNFVPRPINYYLTINIMGERLSKNKRPISI